MEDILIEAIGGGQAFGDFVKNKLDLSISDESLVNQIFFLDIFKTNEDLGKKEHIGKVEMTYMDVCMEEEVGI